MKLFFSLKSNMFRIQYEGNEWKNLEERYRKAGYVEEVLPWVLTKQNENIKCYTHSASESLANLFASSSRSLHLLDSLKKDLLFNQNVNLAVFRIIPENSNVYVYTSVEVTPDVFTKLSILGRMMSSASHMSMSPEVSH